jgi:hypothetical protein
MSTKRLPKLKSFATASADTLAHRGLPVNVPWAALCAVIELHYPTAGNGRPPIGLERMLRIHLLRHWFNLADNAVEEALICIARLFIAIGTQSGRLLAYDLPSDRWRLV